MNDDNLKLNLDSFHSYEETYELLEENQKIIVEEKASVNKNSPKTPAEKRKAVFNFLLPTVLALIFALSLRALVFSNAVVPTGSMENTIPIGSRLIGSKLSYIGSKTPERFDIIIFKYPDDESIPYVKRIIGLPGEKVSIKNGKVYIDNSMTPLDDSFVTNCIPEGNFGPYIVPQGSYFVLGDNRNNSNDSRYWDNTYVSENKIIAKAIFKYYPNFEKF